MIGTAMKSQHVPAIVAGLATLLILQPQAIGQDRRSIELRARQSIELLAGYDQRATTAFGTRSFAELDALNRDLRRTIIARGKERSDGMILLINCDGSIFGLSALVQRAVLKLKTPDRFSAAYDDNASITLNHYTLLLDRCAKDAGIHTFRSGLNVQALKAL